MDGALSFLLLPPLKAVDRLRVAGGDQITSKGQQTSSERRRRSVESGVQVLPNFG